MITTASSPGENVSVMTASSDVNNSIESNHGDTKTQNIESNRQYGSGSNFVRGTTRQSVMGMLSEKYEEDFEQRSNFPANGLRQPPEGMKRNSSDYEDNFTGTYTSRFSSRRYSPPPPIDKSRFPSFYEDSQEMFIENDGSPLGLQVSFLVVLIHIYSRGQIENDLNIQSKASGKSLPGQGCSASKYIFIPFLISKRFEFYHIVFRWLVTKMKKYSVGWW